jgi:hypothetical protein
MDPHGDQPLTEAIGADVLAGALPRKQPRRLVGVSDRRVGAAGCDQLEDKSGERFGQDGWGFPQPDRNRGTCQVQ